MGKDIKHTINESLNQSAENVLRKHFYLGLIEYIADLDYNNFKADINWLKGVNPIREVYNAYDEYDETYKMTVVDGEGDHELLIHYPYIEKLYFILGNGEWTVHYNNKFMNEFFELDDQFDYRHDGDLEYGEQIFKHIKTNINGE